MKTLLEIARAWLDGILVAEREGHPTRHNHRNSDDRINDCPACWERATHAGQAAIDRHPGYQARPIKHTKDCAIHGCEGYNGERFCDCGVGHMPDILNRLIETQRLEFVHLREIFDDIATIVGPDVLDSHPPNADPEDVRRGVATRMAQWKLWAGY